MALDLSALQQKQDQLIYTIDEIVDWMRKVAGQTGYAQLQYYDKNGNLVTKNIPTIPQLIEQFRQGVNAQMAKTVYVHQQEGSDTTGDGSQNAPFKTIEKARDSVPSRGIVSIHLLSDYVVSNDILLSGGRLYKITGQLNPDGSPAVKLTLDPNSKGSFILVENANLYLDNLIIEANKNTETALNWSTILKVVNTTSTIVIGRWVPSTQPKPVEIILNHTLLNVEAGLAILVIRHTKVISSAPRSLITLTGGSSLIYSPDSVLDVNGNVTFPNLGINV